MAYANFSHERGNGGSRPPGFGQTIFLQQSAHVTILDARGRIMTVNDAWTRYGRENQLDPGYAFVGASYVDVCAAAVNAGHGNEGAGEALDGITRILAADATRFSLIYPCHAPTKQRWFLMYVRPLEGDVGGAVVSHVDVTSLHLAGLVPDETKASTPAGNGPRSPSCAGADAVARRILADRSHPLAWGGPRLR